MKKNNNDFSFKSKQIKNRQGINDDTKTIISLVIILIIIGLIVGLLYLFNGKYVNKTVEETTTTTEVSYNPSLTTYDSMFNIKDSEYYVLAYDTTNDAESLLYNTYKYSYSKKTPLYFIDLTDGMNKMYYDKKGETTSNPKSTKDLKVSGTTLYVFKKGVITSTIKDQTKILEKLS